MYENFKKTDFEKQTNIINAAYKVFAASCYKEASTQDIAAYANISKGLLFYYFHNKRDLYFYLYDYGVNLLKDEIFQAIDMSDQDFFHRIEKLSRIKIKVMKKYPDIYRFFMNVYVEEDVQLKDELQHRLYALTGDKHILLDHIDMQRFRKSIDIKLLSNLLIEVAVEHVRTYCLNDHMDVEAILESYVKYLHLLKENFYKDEYL